MRDAQSYPRFSLRTLLIIVALMAAVVLFVARYRSLLNRHDSYGIAKLQPDSADASPERYFEQFEAAAILETVLKTPQIRNLKPVLNASDPATWLSQHLVIRVAPNNAIYIRASGRSLRVSDDNIELMVNTAIDVVKADAAKHGISMIVTSESYWSID